jgi:hypothetical protein
VGTTFLSPLLTVRPGGPQECRADDKCRYHYLLQSEPDLISLDDYVLNTGKYTLN